MPVTDKDIVSLEKSLEIWSGDWCVFAEDIMDIVLDEEQKAILRSVQHNRMTSVASGTSRGKDFIAAVAAMCFLYLMPGSKSGKPESCKIALTAPTERQVKNIMMPEISGIYHKLKKNGFCPGGAKLLTYDIRTDYEDWFLTGFRADANHHEAWSGFHAVNTMFVITEASGIEESIFNAIEGNLQGNSRILLVFNPNITTGYAAASQRSQRWHRFRLDSLNAPNVVEKKTVIPGQVDYDWVLDKVRLWCTPIAESDYLEDEGDFYFEVDGVRGLYRPNDLFRVKVRGMFPKVDSGVLVPYEWIEAANERWKKCRQEGHKPTAPLRLGSDVAGMGRDSSCECYRYDNYVDRFDMHHSGGKADHMATAGRLTHSLKTNQRAADGIWPQVFIDTIGEGAGVYSRLIELAAPGTTEISEDRIHSVKFSEAATNARGIPYKDVTECYEFFNMRAYLYWMVRDWLNPANNQGAMLPPDDDLAEELTQTMWGFMSNGKVKIEAKEDIKKRIGRSPDKADSLTITFFPVLDIEGKTYNNKTNELSKMFF